MKNLNITDNKNLTVDTETGEVIENVSAVNASEEKANELFFVAKQWTVSKDCNQTVGSRSFITDPFGNLTEAWLLGDWNWHWSQIETKDMILERNTDYVFSFWINGGENDRNDEICQFEIMFDNDYESRSIYKLNRCYIKYTKHYKGWYLYRLPFNTGDASYTKFRFVQLCSYCAIIPAKPLKAYKDLPDSEPQANVPQRHNIIFGEEGFPHDSRWSCNVFGSTTNEQKNGFTNDYANFQVNGVDITDEIRNRIQDEINVDDIVDDIVSEIDLDLIADQVRSEIDVESIRENVLNFIKKGFKSN